MIEEVATVIATMTAPLMTFRANRKQKQARLVSAEVQPKSNLLKKLLLSADIDVYEKKEQS